MILNNLLLLLLLSAQLFADDTPLHEHLLADDLKRIFKAENKDDVGDYEVGHLYHEVTNKFSNAKDVPDMVLTVHTPNNRYLVSLQKNKYLIHPDLHHVKKFEDCVFIGQVEHPTTGTAAFSNCHGQGFRGKIMVPEGSFKFDEVPAYVRCANVTQQTNLHFIQKTSSNGFAHIDHHHLRQKRQINLRRLFMALSIVYDDSFEKGKTDDLKIAEVLNIVNQAQLLYLQPSLHRNLWFSINILSNLTDPTVTTGPSENIVDYLSTFCDSQENLKGIDNSILLTGKDLRAGGSYGVIGVAYVSGSCYEPYRCGVIEIFGSNKDTGEVVAHEIGHNLGMDHDCTGGFGTCERTDCNMLGIMSAYAGEGVSTWSDCSNEYVKKFLAKNWGRCMKRFGIYPRIDRRYKIGQLIGRFSLSALCDHQFPGYRAKVDKTEKYKNPCKELYCIKRGSPIKKANINGMTGMRCDSTNVRLNVCHNGECIDPRAPPPPLNVSLYSGPMVYKTKRTSRNRRGVHENIRQNFWYVGDWTECKSGDNCTGMRKVWCMEKDSMCLGKVADSRCPPPKPADAA